MQVSHQLGRPLNRKFHPPRKIAFVEQGWGLNIAPPPEPRPPRVSPTLHAHHASSSVHFLYALHLPFCFLNLYSKASTSCPTKAHCYHFLIPASGGHPMQRSFLQAVLSLHCLSKIDVGTFTCGVCEWLILPLQRGLSLVSLPFVTSFSGASV